MLRLLPLAVTGTRRRAALVDFGLMAVVRLVDLDA